MDLVQALNQKKEAEASKIHDERIFTVAQFNKVAQSVEDMSKLLAELIKKHEPTVKVKNFPAPPKQVDNSAKVIAAIKAIPEPKEADYKEILAAFVVLTADIRKEFAKLDLKPEVKVEAPIVHVKDPDLTPITKAIKAIPKPDKVDLSAMEKKLDALSKQIASVTKAVNDKPVPQVAITPTDPLVRYVASDLDEASATKYYGFVDTGGVWGIREVTSTTIRYAFGTTDYETAWTGRAALTYKRWGK